MPYVDVVLRSTDLAATIEHMAAMRIVVERTSERTIKLIWDDGDKVVIAETPLLICVDLDTLEPTGALVFMVRLTKFYASNLLDYLLTDTTICDWREDVWVDTGEVDEEEEPIMALEPIPEYPIVSVEVDEEEEPIMALEPIPEYPIVSVDAEGQPVLKMQQPGVIVR